MSTEDKKKEDINEIDSWEDLNPRIELLRGIYSNGFEKPSPIQRKAIIPLFENKDLIAQAHLVLEKLHVFQLVLYNQLIQV